VPWAAPASCNTRHLPPTTRWPLPLVVILLLAATLRLPLAFWPNFHHPDEIFQYIEPAWRMLGHDSIVSWEWRYGMRGWLLPTIMAGPIAIGDWIAPGGMSAYVLPRLLAAMASLSIVMSAWAFGARVSRTHAVLAGLVAAIWFELVYFAPHTLSEPLATAVILPAAVLVSRDAPSRRGLIGGGALLALAFLFRFQYAPAIAVLTLGTCWRDWRRIKPLALGGAAILAIGGGVDAMQGAMPLGWLVANVEQNLFQDRAAEFGIAPASIYVAWLWERWAIAVVPLLCAIVCGYRHAPALLWAAFADITFHSFIAHKEPRFVFLSMTVFIIIAALGSADLIALWSRPAWRRLTGGLIAASWIGTSAALAATGGWSVLWMNGIGATKLAADLKADPQMCGLALYNVFFTLLPGRDRLVGSKPLFAFYSSDPFAGAELTSVARIASTSFNRILAYRSAEKDLPASFTARDCATVGGVQVCIFGRDGKCGYGAAALFTLNDVLKRIDL
jgi:GPI mannosyltransferase 3